MRKNPARFWRALVVAIIALALAVYYLIPGITHPRPMGGPTTNPAGGMAIVLFVVALVVGIIAVLARPKANRG